MHLYADTLSHALSHAQSDGLVRLGYQSHEIENDTDTEFAQDLNCTLKQHLTMVYRQEQHSLLLTVMGKRALKVYPFLMKTMKIICFWVKPI